MASVKTCDLNISGCVQFSLSGASDSHTMVSVRSFLQNSNQSEERTNVRCRLEGVSRCIQVYQKVLDTPQRQK